MSSQSLSTVAMNDVWYDVKTRKDGLAICRHYRNFRENKIYKCGEAKGQELFEKAWLIFNHQDTYKQIDAYAMFDDIWEELTA